MGSLQGGFTLIELMIAIAVIGIILAIAIPGLRSSRKSSNEASAVASLKALTSANEQYKARFVRYAGTLRNLSQTKFIDSVLGSGTKSGYSFTYAGGANTWTTRASPVLAGSTGDRGFFVNQTGVIRFTPSGNAKATSPPVD